MQDCAGSEKVLEPEGLTSRAREEQSSALSAFASPTMSSGSTATSVSYRGGRLRPWQWVPRANDGRRPTRCCDALNSDRCVEVAGNACDRALSRVADASPRPRSRHTALHAPGCGVPADRCHAGVVRRAPIRRLPQRLRSAGLLRECTGPMDRRRAGRAVFSAAVCAAVLAAWVVLSGSDRVVLPVLRDLGLGAAG